MSETYGRTDMHYCGCTEDADGYVTVFCAQHRDLELPECCRCEEPIAGTPVTDPEDRAGRQWCSEECLTAADEAAYEQRYQPGVAT